MKFFYSEILDPILNLSIEKWLMSREDLEGTEVILFYRNMPSVIIGRFQNPWLECDLKKMSERSIPLVRRESGGGAVFHDPGNMNFSFICRKDKMIKEEKTNLIVGALKSLGIEAVKGKRNDIFIDGKKISGSAGRYTSNRALHHGTLLIDSDLDSLDGYLTAKAYDTAQVKSQGIPSIRSKVTNIGYYCDGIDYPMICQAIVNRAAGTSKGTGEIIHLYRPEVEKNEEIIKYRTALAGWDWLYGKTPSFSMICPARISGNLFSCRFDVRRGLVATLFPMEENVDNERESLLTEKYLGRRFNDIYHSQSEISAF